MARGTFSTSNYLLSAGAPVTTTPLTLAAHAYQVTSTLTNAALSLLAYEAGTANGFTLLFSSGNAVIARTYSNGSAGSATTSGTLADATWGHAAAVFTSNVSRTAYLNGVASTTNATNRTPTTVPTSAQVGSTLFNNGAFSLYSFSTLWVANACVYDDALTTAEIAQLAVGVSPLLVRPANLVAYWPLLRGDANGDEPDWVGGYTLTEGGTVDVQAHYPGTILAGGWQPWTVYTAAGGGGTAYTGSLTFAGAAAQAQASKLDAIGRVSFAASGALSQAGQLAAVGSASFTASGTLAQTGKLDAATTLTLTAAGALTESSVLAAVGTLTLDAAGALTLSSTLTGTSFVSFTLAAASAMAQTAQLDAVGSATLDASAAVDQQAQAALLAALDLAASSSLATSASLGASVTLTLDAAGALTADSMAALTAALSLAGSAAVTDTAQLAAVGSVTLDALAEALQTATAAYLTTVNLSAVATLAQSGVVYLGAVVTPDGRIHIILFQLRTHPVEADTRTLTVGVDNRTHPIEADTRTYTVPNYDRSFSP